MKNLCFVVILFLSVSSCSSHLRTQAIAANDSKIEWVGRSVASTDGSVSFDWSGSYMCCRFTGEYFAITASDTKQNYYNVWIDGVEQDAFSTHGSDSLIVVASNLVDSEHIVVIQKRTEAEQGKTTIHNVIIEHGAELIDAEDRPSRHIEFIGDSLTCGYGTEGKSKDEPFKAETENCDKAFGCIISRYFGASYSLIAHSGRGVVRNYGDKNSISKNTMKDRMINTFDEDSTLLWSYERHIPDVVVITLGSNDFSTKPHPSKSEFVNGYRSIVGNLRRVYGNTPILCVAPKVDGPILEYVRSFCDESNDSNIYFTAILPGYCNDSTDLGSSSHPNYEGQKKISMLLIPYISTITGWGLDEKIVK